MPLGEAFFAWLVASKGFRSLAGLRARAASPTVNGATMASPRAFVALLAEGEAFVAGEDRLVRVADPHRHRKKHKEKRKININNYKKNLRKTI